MNKDRELSISGERHRRSANSTSSSTADTAGATGNKSSQDPDSNLLRKRQERRFGSFKRVWNLPEDADVSQIKASVDQGVITLTISKTQPIESEVTEIPIN